MAHSFFLARCYAMEGRNVSKEEPSIILTSIAHKGGFCVEKAAAFRTSVYLLFALVAGLWLARASSNGSACPGLCQHAPTSRHTYCDSWHDSVPVAKSHAVANAKPFTIP